MKSKSRKYQIGNKGMSLVELIMVVAILALFTGGITYSINWASGKAAEECAQKLAYSLQQARTMAMGKNSITVTIKKDGDGYIVTETEIVSNTDSTPTTETKSSRVGKKTVTVKFSDGSSERELDTGGVQLVFDRASGALKTLNGAEAGATSPLFTISKGNTLRKVEIVPITGRISVGR